MAEKRKRVVLDLNQKIEIIKHLKKGETANSIALIYGAGRTTVNDIKRDAEKIEQHVSKMQNIDEDPKSRKTLKSAKYGQLDTIMYQCCLRFFCYPSIRLTVTVPVPTLTVNRSFTILSFINIGSAIQKLIRGSGVHRHTESMAIS
jgi:hypothetical protein